MQDQTDWSRLISLHLNTILNSGLLLDEDLEVLLTNCHLNPPLRTTTSRLLWKKSLKVLSVCLVSTALTYLAHKKLGTKLAFAPGTIGVSAAVFLEIRKQLTNRRRADIVNKLVQRIIRARKINVSIIRYMRTRAELSRKDGGEFISLYSKNIEHFVGSVARLNHELFLFILRTLADFCEIYNELESDYCLLKHIDLNEILDLNSLNGVEGCAKLTSTLQDLHVLFCSKLISYLGLILSSTELNRGNVEHVLDVVLPELCTRLENYYVQVSVLFNDLRSCSKIKDDVTAQRKIASKSQISTKLNSALVQSINNLSIVMEKSHVLLSKLDASEDENIKEIGGAILDLRDHTKAIYESLDVLCKLYGILSNAPTRKTTSQPIQAARTESQSNNINTVNYDDEIIPQEEKYELFIKENEKINDTSRPVHEDQSNAYLGLILQELKQSLKQHERFISAKNRRGSNSSDEEVIERVHKIEKAPPKFDLSALSAQTEDSVASSNTTDVEPSISRETANKPVDNLQVVPPPPPPPPPVFNLDKIEENREENNPKSMLQNILALSRQINAEEEVFGDSFESDSD